MTTGGLRGTARCVSDHERSRLHGVGEIRDSQFPLDPCRPLRSGSGIDVDAALVVILRCAAQPAAAENPMQQQDRSTIGPPERQDDLDPIALLLRAAEPAADDFTERFTLVEVAPQTR
jgi:hypothetical protein